MWHLLNILNWCAERTGISDKVNWRISIMIVMVIVDHIWYRIKPKIISHFILATLVKCTVISETQRRGGRFAAVVVVKWPNRNSSYWWGRALSVSCSALVVPYRTIMVKFAINDLLTQKLNRAVISILFIRLSIVMVGGLRLLLIGHWTAIWGVYEPAQNRCCVPLRRLLFLEASVIIGVIIELLARIT